MDYFKSKYSSMPDNSYFDKRMANGEKLSDIFDDTDYKSKCYSSDKERPITVRVGRKYNYVVNNFILFDNWFAGCSDFNEFDKCTFAYRRVNENGELEGGVLIRRDGSFVTREEFLDIKYNMRGDDGGEKYALVRQYNGLYNFIDVDKGTKVDNLGFKADSIDFFYSTGRFIRIAEGQLTRDEENILWGSTYNGKEIAIEKHLKVNYYQINKGILSPDLWFDYVEPFTFIPDGFSRNKKLCNHAIVHLDGKKNLIDQNGHLISDIWFDDAHIMYEGDGEGVVLKSNSLKSLPDTIGEYYQYNPDKYNIFKIDALGRIKAI